MLLLTLIISSFIWGKSPNVQYVQDGTCTAGFREVKFPFAIDHIDYNIDDGVSKKLVRFKTERLSDKFLLCNTIRSKLVISNDYRKMCMFDEDQNKCIHEY